MISGSFFHPNIFLASSPQCLYWLLKVSYGYTSSACQFVIAYSFLYTRTGDPEDFGTTDEIDARLCPLIHCSTQTDCHAFSGGVTFCMTPQTEWLTSCLQWPPGCHSPVSKDKAHMKIFEEFLGLMFLKMN